MDSRTIAPGYSPLPVPHQHEGRPDARMGETPALGDDGGDGAAQRLGAAHFGVGLHGVHRARGDGDGRLRVHVPVRDEQRARAGIEERARQPDSASAPSADPAAVLQADMTTQSALRFNCAASDAVSRPLSSSLACCGRRQQQRGLGLVLGEQRGFARKQPVGGEMNHAGAGQRAALR